MRNEIHAAIGSSSNPSRQDIKKMTYLGNVLKESLSALNPLCDAYQVSFTTRLTLLPSSASLSLCTYQSTDRCEENKSSLRRRARRLCSNCCETWGKRWLEPLRNAETERYLWFRCQRVPPRAMGGGRTCVKQNAEVGISPLQWWSSDLSWK